MAPSGVDGSTGEIKFFFCLIIACRSFRTIIEYYDYRLSDSAPTTGNHRQSVRPAGRTERTKNLESEEPGRFVTIGGAPVVVTSRAKTFPKTLQ